MNAREYRTAQDRAQGPVLRYVRRILAAYGVPVTPEQIEQFARLLNRSMQTARRRNYAATVAYLTALGVAEAEIPDLAQYGAETLADTIAEIIAKLRVAGEPVTLGRRSDPLVVQKTEKALEGMVSRHSQAPAREVVKEVSDGIEGAGWARMLTGPTSCSFCAMLASRGPVYTSEQSAIGRGGSRVDLYHTAYLNKNGKLVGGNCDCIAVLVLDYHTWEGRESFEALEDLWGATGAKASNNDARNAFRRAWDRKVRGGETGEYLAESMK